MEKLKDYTLEIIVMDKDRIGRNECIGKVNEFFLQYFREIHRFFHTLSAMLVEPRAKSPNIKNSIVQITIFRLYWVTKEVHWKGNTGEI